METKVVEREISNHQYVLLFSQDVLFARYLRKAEKKIEFIMLNFQLTDLLQEFYSSSSTCKLIPIKISRRTMHFYGTYSYRVRKKSIQVEL